MTVEGKTIRRGRLADAIQAGIGLAPEDRKSQALLLLRSVKDNISLTIPDRISHASFIDFAAERRIADALVDRLGIRTPTLDTSVSSLSGGNQQKVVLRAGSHGGLKFYPGRADAGHRRARQGGDLSPDFRACRRRDCPLGDLLGNAGTPRAG